jgi:hypothetical protein
LPLAADVGEYAFTGQAAGLRRGYPLSAASGAFSLTGQAATLRYARLPLTADSGEFTFTGQAATLRAARNLPSASGSFAFTGQDATLTYTPVAGAITLAADPGAFVLTGQSATLTYAPVITGTTGGAGAFTPREIAAFKAMQRRMLAQTRETAESVHLLARLALAMRDLRQLPALDGEPEIEAEFEAAVAEAQEALEAVETARAAEQPAIGFEPATPPETGSLSAEIAELSATITAMVEARRQADEDDVEMLMLMAA